MFQLWRNDQTDLYQKTNKNDSQLISFQMFLNFQNRIRNFGYNVDKIYCTFLLIIKKLLDGSSYKANQLSRYIGWLLNFRNQCSSFWENLDARLKIGSQTYTLTSTWNKQVGFSSKVILFPIGNFKNTKKTYIYTYVK